MDAGRRALTTDAGRWFTGVGIRPRRWIIDDSCVSSSTAAVVAVAQRRRWRDQGGGAEFDAVRCWSEASSLGSRASRRQWLFSLRSRPRRSCRWQEESNKMAGGKQQQAEQRSS